VIRVLIAAAVGLGLSVVIGPRFIEFLREHEFGQHIREEGPQHHIAKQGTPTMGGLLILCAATIAFLPVSHFRLQALTVIFTALACMLAYASALHAHDASQIHGWRGRPVGRVRRRLAPRLRPTRRASARATL